MFPKKNSPQYHLQDWEIRDRVSRLEVGRENALRRRGIRWAAPRDGTDKQNVHQLRKDQIKTTSSKSLILEPDHPESLNNNPRRKEK